MVLHIQVGGNDSCSNHRVLNALSASNISAMKTLFLKTTIFYLILLLGNGAWCQTNCNYQQNELRKLGLAAKYEQLSGSQRASFFSQLTSADQISVMSLSSGHNLGAGINNAAGGGYSSTITDVFNQKAEEFRRSCGFMLK